MKKYVLLASGLLALGSCAKKNDAAPTPTAQTKTALLAAHAWKVSSVAATITVAGITAPYPLPDSACIKDNIYRFNTDQSALVDEGATKCDPTDPQQTTGTWAFPNNDQTKLHLSASPLDGLGINDFDIKELTATTLHLYVEQNAGGITGATYKADITLVPN